MQYAAAHDAVATTMDNEIFSIPGIGIGTVGLAYSLLALASSVAAYGLLALIVHRTSHPTSA